jgi:hypothetical protein
MAAFILAGCTGPAMAPYSPAERRTELAPEKLYAAAEGALLDGGYLIKERDPAGHRLETEPRTLLGSEIDKDKYRYWWIVETGGGTLKLRLSCQHVEGDETEDCGDERPEKLVREQDELLDAIVGEAGSQ